MSKTSFYRQLLWFWSEEWQAMEREADEDLVQGRYQDFETMDDMIADLVSREDEPTGYESTVSWRGW